MDTTRGQGRLGAGHEHAGPHHAWGQFRRELATRQNRRRALVAQGRELGKCGGAGIARSNVRRRYLWKPRCRGGTALAASSGPTGQHGCRGVTGILAGQWRQARAKNQAEGVRWDEKAGAKRGAAGYYAMGYAYQYGKGESVDPAKAWYNFAAAQRVDAKHQFDKVGDHMSTVAAELSSAQTERLRAEVSKIPLPGEPSLFD